MTMTMKTGSRISRRRFLEQCGEATALVLVIDQYGSGQATSAGTAKVQFKLVKEIKDAFYRAVSPDSRRICLCFTRKPVGRVILGVTGNQRTVSHDPPGPFAVAVVELGSWKEIYSAPLLGDTGLFSFFMDGDTLYGETVSLRFPVTRESMLIDLRTGSVEKPQKAYDKESTGYYSALKDHILIGVKGDRELVQVEWPSFREVVRITVEGNVSVFRLTADRKHLIHLVDQSLVCRRVEDFGVVWTRQIDPDIDLKAKDSRWSDPEKAPHLADAAYCISADGNRVAVAPGQASDVGKPGRFYLEILNGKDGTPVVRWSKDRHDGIEFSPDGRLLALAELADSKSVDLEPTVHVYDVPRPERSQLWSMTACRAASVCARP